jgi:hypothetical protein
MATPVIAYPFQDDEAQAPVNTLSQAPIPTLNAAESAATEDVNDEVIETA